MSPERTLVIRLIPLALVVIFGGLLFWDALFYGDALAFSFGALAVIYAVVRLDMVFCRFKDMKDGK